MRCFMGFFDIFRVSKIKEENTILKNKLTEIGCDEYEQVKNKLDSMEKISQQNLLNAQKELDSQNLIISENNETILRLRNEISTLNESMEKLQKQVGTQSRKLQRSKEIYKSIEYCISNFLEDNAYQEKLTSSDLAECDELTPSIMLKLHCMDVKDLKKAYRENDKQISKLLEMYSSRYTTKANQTIYQLMVIALRAELQNILYNLKYEKLEQSIEDVKVITAKYLKLAIEGNQSIAGTMTKFIGEIEYLFINAVKIEYNYYVKREQAKQEQMAIREQMRQEAAERKALEEERKRIEKEESKYTSELEKLKEQIITATEAELQKLNARILQLQSQLSDVAVKKNDIINLQNGKAGNIYIISNLGSFGENVFKIGMTRRLDPQDRVNELGDASVPFKFDVHSFIFSDDAVSLEKYLHTTLNDKRVNKVNLRKEFFRVSIDELEHLVNEIDPTAAFNKTMLAEEFRQSLSTDEPYTKDYHDDFVDEEE